MLKRAASAIVVMLGTGATVGAQVPGLVIDHQEIDCVVAGKFPRLGACIDPTRLARARVYFRAEGGPHWYFVEMKPDNPCLSGILPKPKRSTPRINYYIEAVNREFAESRTKEYAPEVVDSAEACRKRLAAPFLQQASVVVGGVPGAPAVPVGFLASGIAGTGVSPTVIVAAVGGGAAVAGTALVVTNNDDNPPTSPSITATIPTPPSPPVTPPSPPAQPPTPAPSGPNQPPNLVCRVDPNPPSGKAPFLVRFNLCPTSDPDGDPLTFTFDFGDGVRDRGSCRTEHLYGSDSASYSPNLCATDGIDDHLRCCGFTVNVAPKYPVNGLQPLTWATELQVPGARGQVVLNGATISFPGEGRSHGSGSPSWGEHRVEALLVDARGRPGTWRFDLGLSTPFVPGSLRVVAGDAALLTYNAVTFRMQGKPGERVVFTFRTWR